MEESRRKIDVSEDIAKRLEQEYGHMNETWDCLFTRMMDGLDDHDPFWNNDDQDSNQDCKTHDI